MVGNMFGTSLSMAPAYVVAQLCDFVDIDGPLLLKYDHPLGLTYEKGVVGVFDSNLWGWCSVCLKNGLVIATISDSLLGPGVLG